MTTLNLLFGASGLALTAEVYYLHGPLLGTAVAAFYLACALLGYRLRHRSNPKKGLTMSWISKNVTGDPKAVAGPLRLIGRQPVHPPRSAWSPPTI